MENRQNFFRRLTIIVLVSFLILAMGAARNGQARADETQKPPSGNDHPDFFAMYAKGGLMLISNGEGAYFYVRIQGNKVRQGTIGEGANQFGVVVADGLILQFNTAWFSDFLKGDPSQMTDEEILKKHAEWEIAYAGEKFKQPIQMGMNLHIKGLNKKIYYYWTYEIPKPAEGGVKKNIMLTTRVKNEIVVLDGMLLTSNEKEEEAMMKKLVEIMNSLTLFPNPITVNQAKSYAVKD